MQGISLFQSPASFYVPMSVDSWLNLWHSVCVIFGFSPKIHSLAREINSDECLAGWLWSARRENCSSRCRGKAVGLSGKWIGGVLRILARAFELNASQLAMLLYVDGWTARRGCGSGSYLQRYWLGFSNSVVVSSTDGRATVETETIRYTFSAVDWQNMSSGVEWERRDAGH